MKAPNPPANRFDSPDLFDAARRAFAGAALVRGPRSPARRALAACLLAGLLFGQASAAVGASARPRASKARKPAAAKKATDAAAKDGAAAAKGDEAAATPKPLAPPASITIEEPDVSAYPSDGGLKKYAIVIKRKEGEFFGTDPSLVSLSLTPAGTADVTIRRVTPTRIEADFWAPDKFKVNDVGVTVYDSKNRQLVVASSDLAQPGQGEETETAGDGTAGVRMTAASGTSASKPSAPKTPTPKEDEQPKINSTAVVFLQRAYGIGRLKIEGENFGNYETPKITAEDYLLCFEPLARQALIDALDGSLEGKTRHELEDQRCKNLSTDLASWNDWRGRVERLVKIALVPRNTDLRIEQTKILYIDDKLIDVYFEFNRYANYSEPLRLASATVTVKKEKERKAGGQLAASRNRGDVSGGGHGASDAGSAGGPSGGDPPGGSDMPGDAALPCADPKDCATFIATTEVGPKQDQRLTYKYTVYDENSATTLFGKGVAKNFYVIQVSVTNRGEKKVSIPLASIEAEIEWAHGPVEDPAAVAAAVGSGERNLAGSSTVSDVLNIPPSPAHATSQNQTFYEEGPVTLAPTALSAVTAYFDGDVKANGRKAKFFNITDGLATLGSSLIPFFGPGFKDAHVAFTGGLVPGIRRGLGDLSGEQLQNLTAQSWQSAEVVSANGGSIEKFVFFPRGDQVYAPRSNETNETLVKKIKNIEGMEVVGFEVIEANEGKRATPAGQQ